ncbi:MAG: glutamyl-tRNA reductase [Thermoanaerobaculia bacterium]
MSDLVLVGLNHRTAPVEIRERVHVGANELEGAVASLRALPGVEGASLLSTCNRVEAIVSAGSGNVMESIVEWMSARAGSTVAQLEAYLYILRHGEVVNHLFRVASGLDSMIIGEPQIGGQVRCAFHTARKQGSFDPLLRQVFEQTLRVAKKVRSETGIGLHAVSIPYAAVELAKKIFGELKGLRVLLVGAGDMGELTAEHLHKQQVQQVIVANRSYERAVELAQRFHGEAVQFDSIDEHLAASDIVITSTSAPHYVLDAAQVRRAMETRRRRSLFLIDLSVPRNLDPEIAAIEHAYLYNVDDLRHVAADNAMMRKREGEEAERIIGEEVLAFQKRLMAQDAVPTIRELQQRIEEIRAAELEKCLRKLGPIAVEQRDAIEQLTQQMTNKILHYPIVHLKESSDAPQERESVRRTIRKMFGLA